MFKRMMSLFICFTLAVSVIAFPAESLAASSGSLTATRGVYWFDPHEVGMDLTDTFVFDDALLKGDSKAYNRKLATMTFELAIASISSEREPKTKAGYANKSRNLRAYLEDNGFSDFETNKYYKEKMTTETMGVACAHKKITDGGKTYTLLAIVPRSAGYESEWGGNFEMGSSGDHAGFKKGRKIVLDFAKSYIKKHSIKGNIKVWTSGYSRGAGVTNQVAAAIISDPKGALGSKISLSPKNIYCYTFGTPNSAGGSKAEFGDPSSSKFDYIHNTWEPYDIVTVAPPTSLGFARYGKSTGYAKPENKTRMLKLLKKTNKQVYDIYMNGGDPDGFYPKTIDIIKLITEKKLSLKNDSNSYMPKSQKEFLAMMEESIIEAAGSRAGYVDGNYEIALKHLAGYFFSHMSQSDKLIGGISGSRFTAPFVAFLYISYMVERYRETTFDEQTIEEIKKAAAMLEEVISEAEAAGITIPKELKDELEAMKKQIKASAKWGVAADSSRLIAALLYSLVMADGLTASGLDKEDTELFKSITSVKEAKAATRLVAFLLLYDNKQTDKVITFKHVTQQMKHLATFAGNAASYMRPHNNEIIVSWLKTLDSNYDGITKESDAQTAGYRRLYIDRPEGVTVTGVIKNGSKTVARFKNDKITSRSDKWIGITTADKGNWLRLPVDKTYKVELSVSKDTKLDLKAAEYEIYSNKVVRTVTKDRKYNWKNLSVGDQDKITWVISKVSGKTCKLPSKADYYIEKDEKSDEGSGSGSGESKKEKTYASRSVLVARGTARGKTSIKFNWNKLIGASRYVVYFSSCNRGDRKFTPKKVKVLSAKKRTWTKTGLKRYRKYKYYVVAQKKVNGKYKNIAKSYVGHTIAGGYTKTYSDPKSIKLSKNSFSLKKGKTAKVKAKVTLKVSGKKLVTHAPRLRYKTNSPRIASVTRTGKIKAVSNGTATIFVQAANGMWKTAKVTVK